MNNLIRFIRPFIIILTLCIILGVFIYFTLTIPTGSLQTIRITQTYALLAFFYLYITLLASPLQSAFPNLGINRYLIKGRRATGVSVFMFALLHASFAFFGQLGGFEGLGFLSSTYLVAITMSFIALLILGCMSATSFDYMMAKMGFSRWKMLHRLVYIAGILIIIHALLLGTHFSDTSGVIYTISSIAIAALFILEALRLDIYMKLRFNTVPQFGIFLVFTISAIVWIFLSQYHTETTLLSNIHSKHLQMAKDMPMKVDQDQAMPMDMNFSGMQGDRTKRYSVSIDKEELIVAGKSTTFTFQVYDASSGDKVVLFSKMYDKLVHLIIVDNKLEFFNHIHPEYKANGFSITTQFPHDGLYRLYLDFQPVGAIEQQFAFTVLVGKSGVDDIPHAVVDTNLSKVFGKYKVDLSQARQKISFNLYDAATLTPITILKPYLSAFGHLVMINTETFEYIHVHPASLTPPAPNENGGPTVEFIPMSLYSTIKPGIYRVFAQFNPDNQLFTTDFTVMVK